jgi:hypothetical protein
LVEGNLREMSSRFPIGDFHHPGTVAECA